MERKKRGRPRKATDTIPFWQFTRAGRVMCAYDEARGRGEKHMGESGETYRRILLALQKSMRPVDSYEELLVEKLAFLYILLIRVYKADWRLAPKLFEKLEESVGAEYNPFITQGLIDFGGKVIGHRKDPTPELLIRYESHIERQISRTIDQFERWRMMRPNNSKPPAELEEQIESQEVKVGMQSDIP